MDTGKLNKKLESILFEFIRLSSIFKKSMIELDKHGDYDEECKQVKKLIKEAKSYIDYDTLKIVYEERVKAEELAAKARIFDAYNKKNSKKHRAKLLEEQEFLNSLGMSMTTDGQIVSNS